MMENDKKPTFWQIMLRPQRLFVMLLTLTVAAGAMFFIDHEDGGGYLAAFTLTALGVVVLNAAFGEEAGR